MCSCTPKISCTTSATGNASPEAGRARYPGIAPPGVGIRTDRKSVVEGKRVDLGGRRILKKKKTDGDGAVVVEPEPPHDGLRLRVDWLHLVSHAQAQPVCMSAGLAEYRVFFSSRRRHTILQGDWSSDVCSSD